MNEKKEEEVDEEKEKEKARLEEEKAKLELEKKKISQGITKKILRRIFQWFILFKIIFKDEMALAKELSDDYVIDLRNYLPIGPILNLGLYKIPPQPKKVKQWTIRQSIYLLLNFFNLNKIL